MVGQSQTTEKEARFNALIEDYGKFLRNAIARLCPKDLGIQFDDIEQEARLRLWRALQDEKEIDNPASYLFRIAATTTIDAVRRVKARREEPLRQADDDDAEMPVMTAGSETSPERAAERQQAMNEVDEALARLPERRRRAVALYLEGLTSQEIADLLGWSEPKARNLLYRGLKELRQQLRAAGIEYEID